MIPPYTFDFALIRQWELSNMNADLIRRDLEAKGMDEDIITEYIKAFKKAVNARRQMKGFIFLAAGAFLGFLSCVLTLLNTSPGLYSYTLYGLTMVAVVLICVGLYFVFE